MVSTRPWIARAPILALCLGLFGCHGSMSIYGFGSDDDDSAGPPGLDFASLTGTDMVNIDWGQQAKEQGREDCVAVWDVQGVESTADDGNLCPECDHIWTLNLAPQGRAEECLADTNESFQGTHQARLGFAFEDEINFTVWRTTDSENAPLELVGEGALDDTDYTWSGRAEDYRESSFLGYEWYFSGEGTF